MRGKSRRFYLSWANRLAQLARDASLLARGVPPQGVLPAEARAQGALLEGVVDRGGFFKDVAQGDAEAADKLSQEDFLGGTICQVLQVFQLTT